MSAPLKQRSIHHSIKVYSIVLFKQIHTQIRCNNLIALLKNNKKVVHLQSSNDKKFSTADVLPLCITCCAAFFFNNFKQQQPYNNVTDRNESRSTLLGWYICLGILQTNRDLDYLEHLYALLAFTHLQKKNTFAKEGTKWKNLGSEYVTQYHIDFASLICTVLESTPHPIRRSGVVSNLI